MCFLYPSMNQNAFTNKEHSYSQKYELLNKTRHSKLMMKSSTKKKRKEKKVYDESNAAAKIKTTQLYQLLNNTKQKENKNHKNMI